MFLDNYVIQPLAAMQFYKTIYLSICLSLWQVNNVRNAMEKILPNFVTFWGVVKVPPFKRSVGWRHFRTVLYVSVLR